jgi:hypothetical protein
LVYLFYRDRKIPLLSAGTRYAVCFLFGTIALSVSYRVLVSGDSLMSLLRDIRVHLPFYSVLLVLLQGLKIQPRLMLKVILSAISLSGLYSIFIALTGMEIGSLYIEGQELSQSGNLEGRVLNLNSLAAIFGLALLALRDRCAFIGDKALAMATTITCLVLVIVGIIGFNRTILFFYPLLMSLFMLNLNNFKRGFIVMLAFVVSVVTAVILYQTNFEVREQLNRRVVYPLAGGQGAILENIYFGNREVLYRNYAGILKEHWGMGAPQTVAFKMIADSSGVIKSRAVDVSILSLWLRHGVISMVAFVFLYARFIVDFYKSRRVLRRFQVGHGVLMAIVLALSIYMLIGLNVNIIASNGLAFLLIFGYFYRVEVIRKCASSSLK